MMTYRAYIRGSDGHFRKVERLDAADDQAAVEQGRQYVDGHDVEVWQGGRKVTTLKHQGP